MARRRTHRRLAFVTTVTVISAGLFASSSPAHAVLTTQDKTLYRTTGAAVPRYVYDRFGNSTRMATCKSYPGVTMDGDVFARAYITSSSYVKLYFTFATHYDDNVAIAKNARPDMSCLQLAQFASYHDKYGDDAGAIRALNDSGCAVPNATFFSPWCRLTQWELDPAIGGVQDPKHLSYKTLSLDLNELCRQPEYVRDPNTDQPYVPPHKTQAGLPVYRGPARYVAWHDPGVTLQQENLDGSVTSAAYSGLNDLTTGAGIALLAGQLASGALSWHDFLEQIAAGVLHVSLSHPILTAIASILELVVLEVFHALVDTNAPVKVGDFTVAAGRSPIDPAAKRPDGSGKYGTYVGYGKVQDLSASDDYANWLSQQAMNLYLANRSTYPNPTSSPAAAITMLREVAKKIATTKDPLHQAALAKRGTYCVNKDSAGNVMPGKNVPWMSAVMENWGDNATVSEIALDYMLRGWAHNMVGGVDTDPKFICTAAQQGAMAVATRRATVHAGADDPNNPLNDPWLRALLECQVGTIGKLIGSIWIGGGTDDRPSQANYCMNRYPSIVKSGGQFHFYAPNAWATLTDKDFHCGEDEHFRAFFSLLQGFA